MPDFMSVGMQDKLWSSQSAMRKERKITCYENAAHAAAFFMCGHTCGHEYGASHAWAGKINTRGYLRKDT